MFIESQLIPRTPAPPLAAPLQRGVRLCQRAELLDLGGAQLAGSEGPEQLLEAVGAAGGVEEQARRQVRVVGVGEALLFDQVALGGQPGGGIFLRFALGWR